jgi:hypothetical protein
MKTFLLKLLLFITTGFASINTFGEVVTSKDGSLENLLQNAGVNQFLKRTPFLIQDALDQLQGNQKLNQEAQEKLAMHSLAVLHPSLLEQDIIKHLQATFSAEEKQKLLAFFNGTSYQTFKQLREAVLLPEQKDNLIAYHHKLKLHPVNNTRKQLMVAIDKASHQSLLETRLSTQTFYSLNQLATRLVTNSELIAQEDYEQATFSQYQAIQESIHFYSFRTIPNTELEEYLAALNDPLNQRFFSSLDRAIEQSISQRLNTTIALVE